MEIKDRIKIIMNREQLNAGAFAASIGVSQATISHILGGRNKNPSTDVILQLSQAYPDINLEWLLTGNGSMSKSGADEGTACTGEEADSGYSLFAENAENAANGTGETKNRKENGSHPPVNRAKESVVQEIVYKERPPRKITEIRIFFDDNTYETFRPER